MKKRYVYSLLFGVHGFFVFLIIAFAVFGVAAGVFWLYAFGDTWPASTEIVLPAVFFVPFLTGWFTAIAAGYIIGKKFENKPGLNRRHILLSAVATVIPVLLIIIHQFSVGNIGPKSDTVRCSEYCGEQEYAASGMPPKNSGDTTCICYDSTGRVAVTVPIDSVIANN